MANSVKDGICGGDFIESIAKMTRQGSSMHTKLSATSRNARRKRYRGQGRS